MTTAADSFVTAQILRDALATLRDEGWSSDGWGLLPPWSLRQAIRHAVYKRFVGAGERDGLYVAAINVLAAAIGNPLGGVSNWERFQTGKDQDNGPVRQRKQADVEQLLERAIELCGVKAA